VQAAAAPSWPFRTRRSRRRGLEGNQRGLSFIRYFLLGFGGIALFVGAFVIFNTCRSRWRSARASSPRCGRLGASRRQCSAPSSWRPGHAGCLASAIGMVLGIGIAKGMNELFKAMGTDLRPPAP
jgi:putative ABC transport system permease protein